MAEVMLNQRENLVKRLNVNLVVRKWAFPIIGLSYKSGVLFLTSERLIVHKRSTWLFYFGGALAYSSDGKFFYDIQLKQLKEIRKEKAGLLGNAIFAVTSDGKEYQFVIKTAEFIQALERALAAYHKLRLISDSDSHWIIRTD